MLVSVKVERVAYEGEGVEVWGVGGGRVSGIKKQGDR